MADDVVEIKDDAAFQATLNDQQKTYFTKTVKTASEAAVTKFKTDAETDRKSAVPEKYELALADGTPLVASDKDAIAAYAKENGLTKDQAQKLADHVQARAKGVIDRQTALVETERVNWKKQVETDKDLGGDKLAETLKVSKRALDFITPKVPGLIEMLNETGYGNHPIWVRLMYTIGQAMGEDKGLGGPAGGGKTVSAAKRLYPNLP